MGIASEGYCAVKSGRKFIGVELKESYYDLSVRNMEQASQTQYDMFSE
jgi:DNA modification methylase